MTLLNRPPAHSPAPAPIRLTPKSYKVTYTVRSGMRGHYQLMAVSEEHARWAMQELVPTCKVVSVLHDNGEW